MSERQVRYFLRHEAAGGRWSEVTKAEFVSVERAAGFRNTWGRDSEPATSGFGNGAVQGTVRFDGSAPEDLATPLHAFAEWLAAMDDPDPASQGFQDRRTVTMTQIIEKAQRALDVS